MRIAPRTLAPLAVAVILLPAIWVAAPARSPGDAARVASVVEPTGDFSRPEAFEINQAGAATAHGTPNEDAFSRPSANMSLERRMMFSVGDGVFRKFWVSAPSSTTASDGLGPLFNARACQSCHLRDGRGRPPEPGEEGVSMFLRLSVPPRTDAERAALASGRVATLPEPTYGGQLRDIAIPGHRREGRIVIDYTDVPVTRAALHRRGEQLRFLEASEDVDIRLKQYLGDIAFDSQGATVAATSPVGSVVAFWDGASGAYLRTADASDGCSGSA